MGLFRRSYLDIENIIRIGEGNNAAYRHTKTTINNSFDIKWLRVIAQETMFKDLSAKASARANYLNSLSRRERKQLEKAHRERQTAESSQQKQFNEAAKTKDTPEYWLKKLYEEYATENDYGRSLIKDGLLAYGNALYPHVHSYLFTIAKQYDLFTDGVQEINLNFDEGRRKKAMIEAYTSALKYGSLFLSRFTASERVQDISTFYDYIREHIYSDPIGGFGDLFNAVTIRQYVIRAMGKATKDHSATVSFYVKALNDSSCFVRWEAIDNLKEQWTPKDISQNIALRQALITAREQEGSSVSNRKAKLNALLGGA